MSRSRVWSWDKDKKQIQLLRAHRIAYLRRKWAREGSYQLAMFSIIHDIYADAECEYPVICGGSLFFLDVAIPLKGVDFEYDGADYHKDKAKDRWRDRKLGSNGWHVYRLNRQNFHNLLTILRKV